MKKLFKAPDLQANAWMCFGTSGGLAVALAPAVVAPFAIIFNILLGLYYLWLDANKLVLADDATGELYLTRYHLIRTPWFRVFLHRIYRADKDRDPHNHPWPRAFALVLRGGYMERITELDGLVRVTRGRVHNAGQLSTEAFKPNRYHRIIDVAPNTWTLFFAGRRKNTEHGVSGWGFLVDTEHVPARPYLGLPDNYDFGD